MRVFAVVLLVLLAAACGGSGSPAATLPPASATPSASPAATSGTSFPPTVVASPTAAPVATGTPNPQPTSTVIVSPPPPLPSPPLPVGDTGVAGVALIGPTCPVQRIDSPCPDRPWQGVVSARTTGGVEVAQAATDANGAFSMHLAPGVYDIVTLTSGPLPAPVTQRVTVRAGEVTQVQLMLDSGIR